MKWTVLAVLTVALGLDLTSAFVPVHFARPRAAPSCLACRTAQLPQYSSTSGTFVTHSGSSSSSSSSSRLRNRPKAHLTMEDVMWNATILMSIAWAVMSANRRASEQEYGALDEDDDAADFGSRGYGYESRGPVCLECDNTREVACRQCRAKGFFVDADAIPSKCAACAGLGKLRCPECEGRSRQRSSSSKRQRSRRSLPPPRDRELW